jgi:hypothetical protein
MFVSGVKQPGQRSRAEDTPVISMGFSDPSPRSPFGPGPFHGEEPKKADRALIPTLPLRQGIAGSGELGIREFTRAVL